MIADCEACERKQAPCKSCQESQRAVCYRCDGDLDDPYCEAEENAMHQKIDRGVVRGGSYWSNRTPEVYVSCSECAGEGHTLHSRYGGNDPDVWSVRCEYCGAAGGFIREARGDKMIKQFVETPVTTWEPDDTTPRNCDCGFSADACKMNNCQRKKIATSGLVPDAKWPDTGF